MRLLVIIIIIVVIILIFLSSSGTQETFTPSITGLRDNQMTCGPNATMTAITNTSGYVYNICLPNVSCAPETCPPPLGKCVNGVCQFNPGYSGIATYPFGMSTYYCNLSSGGCHGVTQNNFPEVNAATISKNLNLPICDQNTNNNPACIGIAAAPPMIVGNSEMTTDSNGKPLPLWGQGMTEYTGVCYELTGPTGKTAIVALTDRCGGYCKCKGSGYQECGPCVNASDMQPNCPCVGTVPGLYNQCCGLTQYGCPAPVNSACDWCSSNNHPHFDLDTGTYDHLLDGQSDNGSIVLKNIRPVKCMTPLNWPPSGGGGGGYVHCPTSGPGNSWDTGTLGPGSCDCSTGRCMQPGDPRWPNSNSATHWCCLNNPSPSPPIPTPPIPTPPVPTPPVPTPPVPTPPVPVPTPATYNFQCVATPTIQYKLS